MEVDDQKSCGLAGKDETCEACGAVFRCEPKGTCWCFGETVPTETLKDIQARYARCLCPMCLKQAVERTTVPQTTP